MESRFRYPVDEKSEVPPAPYVNVRLAGTPDVESTAFFPALVDSGADRTIVPFEIANLLNLEASSASILVSGVTGEMQTFPLYFVYLAIANFPPQVVEAIVMASEEYVTVGRDVLNRYRVLLDGPARTVTVFE